MKKDGRLKVLHKLASDRKGSYTVEACLTVTTVLFVLFALSGSFLYLSQRAMLSAAAGYCAQKGAELWAAGSSSAGGGSEALYEGLDMSEKKVSESINITEELDEVLRSAAAAFSENEGAERKMNRIRYALLNRLGRCILKPEKTDFQIVCHKGFMSSRIQVTIIQEVRIPFGYLKAVFDGKKTLTMTAAGTAVLAEPAEYIRNVDLSAEYGARLAGKLDSMLDRIRHEAAKE